ncbi:MAG: methyltransferase family protein [Gemmatimonadaceae bacterium]
MANASDTHETATLAQGPGVHVPAPFIYAVPFVLGILAQRARPLPLLPHAVARRLGAALVVVAVGLLGYAMLTFLRARTAILPIRPASALVESGPYRFTRNPMYVTMALVYLGVALWANALWPVLLLPFALVAVRRFVIAREERYLEARFGEAYRVYKGRVRRWL